MERGLLIPDILRNDIPTIRIQKPPASHSILSPSSGQTSSNFSLPTKLSNQIITCRAIRMAPQYQTKLFINNEVRHYLTHKQRPTNHQDKYVDAKSKDTIDIYNPNDDSLAVSGVQVAGAEDIDAAVDAATKAFKTGPWRKFTGQQRAACLLKMADLVEANTEKLAKLETVAMGVPVLVGKLLVGMAVQIFRCKLSSSTLLF